MSMAEIMTGIALLLSVINVGLMVANYRRASSWKEGEEAQRLIGRVGSCESAIQAASGQGAALSALALRVSATEGDITGLKVRMENVATKADMSRVTAEVEAGNQHIRRVEAGVDRIESHLMNLKGTK